MKRGISTKVVAIACALWLMISALFFVMPVFAQESNVANAKQQYEAFRYTEGVTQYPYTSQYYDAVATATTQSVGPLTNHTLWKLPLYRVLGANVAYGRIWVTSGGPTNSLMCLNAYTGETIWRLISNSTLSSVSAPYFDPANDAATMGYIYVIFNGGLSCFRASDGAPYWNLPLSQFQSFIANSAFPRIAPGFGPVGPTSSKYIYVADGDGNIAVGAQGGYHIWAISKGTSGGKIAWATPVDNQTNYWSGGPMTLADGVLHIGEYASNNPPNGREFAFNATTGSLMWSTVIAGVSTYAVTVSDGIVYTNISPGWNVPGGAIIALNAKTGAIIWRFNTTGIPMSNPIIYKNYLYQASYLDDKLFCLDKTTGKLQWSMDSPGGGRGMTLANGLIYGTAYGDIISGAYNNGFFYCLDPSTNTLKWKYYLDNSIFSTNNGAYSRGFAVADGIAYGGDLTGTFYAFGKGPTTTEISTTDANTVRGTAVAIYGKVYDESPASPGAPVMNTQVKLMALKLGDSSWADIGTPTTDNQGRFVSQWTPQSEGTYKVMAKFDGTDDYGWSSSTTVIQVNPAPTPPAQPSPSPMPTPASASDIANQIIEKLPTPAPVITPAPASAVAEQVVEKLPAYSVVDLALIGAVVVVAILVVASIVLQVRKPKK